MKLEIHHLVLSVIIPILFAAWDALRPCDCTVVVRHTPL